MKYAILLSLLLAGCAGTSGVQPIGRSTYQVLRWDNTLWAGGLNSVKSKAQNDASAYCGTLNLSAEVTETIDTPRTFEQGAQTELRFTCKPAA